jgi:hypothetical protein
MNELLSLFPVLFLVYLLQCIASAPNTSEIFFLGHRMRGRRLRHALQFGRSQNKIFFLNPFLPSVGATFVDPPPFMVRRDGAGELLGIESLFCPASGNWRQSCSFDVPHKFTAEETTVVVDGSPFLSVRSEEEARRVAAFLEKIGTTPPKKRPALLEKYYRNMFSIEAIDKRLGEYSRGTEMLHIACFYLLLFMFFLAPSLVFFRGLHRLWPILLAYLVVSCWLILWLYRRSHRYLYPLKHGGTLPHMIGIALSPFAAIRANDSLLADLLAGFHPVAVAHRTLPKKEFLEFAGLELRKMKYISSDESLLQFLTEFLALEQVDLGALLAPPVLESKLSRSFCPVCLTQYVIDTGVCEDCGNIALEPFSENNREFRESSSPPLS